MSGTYEDQVRALHTRVEAEDGPDVCGHCQKVWSFSHDDDAKAFSVWPCPSIVEIDGHKE